MYRCQHGEERMPFDCTPIIDAPKPLPAIGGDVLDFSAVARTTEPVRARPIPTWHASRRPERVGATVAVLVRARELIADERRWCRGSLARGWLDIPVRVRSGFARRYCALGAIMRAGRELGLSAREATQALEWQTVRRVPNWNDDPQRTHGEVIAAFDAAVYALDGSSV
jgi:hypothetical protein